MNPNRPLPTTGLTVNFTQAQADALFKVIFEEGALAGRVFTKQLDAALYRFSDAYAELQQERADRQRESAKAREERALTRRLFP